MVPGMLSVERSWPAGNIVQNFRENARAHIFIAGAGELSRKVYARVYWAKVSSRFPGSWQA